MGDARHATLITGSFVTIVKLGPAKEVKRVRTSARQVQSDPREM